MAEGLGDLLDAMDPSNIVKLFKSGEAVDAILKVLSDSEVDVTEVKPDGSSLLQTFAMLGCYEIVKLLWDKGCRPSILKLDDSTILHSAVKGQDDTKDSERAQLLTLFLSSDECRGNSMPIDYQNSKGWTALKLATRKNLEKCVEVLLEHGADPDIPDCEQYSALHNAIGNPDIVKLLLTKAKNINQQNQDGETALYMAAERGCTDSVLTLLEHGADPNLPNKEGITPLFLAARGGHLELLKALVRKGGDPNTLGASQRIGPLHWAAHKEHEEIALFLIENHGDLMLQDKEGRTPLSMASPELATKMIAAAQRINPGLTSLAVGTPPMSADEKAMAACCGGNVQALQALLQAGVPINHVSGSTNSTLLHMAAYCGQLHVVVFLLGLRADWKAVDKDGDTVLHFACMKEVSHGLHDKTLEFLLTTPVSALKNSRNCRGDTPVMVATRCQFVTRVKTLLRFKVDVNIANNKDELPVHRSCSSDKNMEALLYFTEMTSDINVQDSDGWSPLMYAAKAEASTIVKYLLQRGADPNIRQPQGFAALYLAAQEDNPSICQLLLEGGADPCLVGGPQKLSPLHIAAHRGSRAVCMVLIEYGADIHMEDGDGDTPLSLADSADLKQAMMLANAARQVLEEARTTSNEQANDTGNNRATNENAASDDRNICPMNEGNGENVSNEPTLPRQSTFSKETESDERHKELTDELQIQTKRIADLESELVSLQSDKDLLVSRNKLLEEEREMAAAMSRMSLDDATSPSCWWLVNKSEYEVTGEHLNATGLVCEKFFDVHRGLFRCMPVAVKRVRNVGQWSEEVYKTFQREVNHISRLQCPYIVQFLGASTVQNEGKVEGECVLLMEIMARGSLESVLHVDRIPLDWNTRLKIVKDVCCGMAFLHAHKVLHRSLMSRNILIGEHFNAKISDCGLHETKTKSDFYTQLRTQCTKPLIYMSPEAMERFEFTAAADVYSFGIVMCEAATGQMPFADIHLSPVVLVMKLMMGLRPSFNGGVPNEYQRLAEKCWHGDPNLRPTFQTILEELRKM